MKKGGEATVKWSVGPTGGMDRGVWKLPLVFYYSPSGNSKIWVWRG